MSLKELRLKLKQLPLKNKLLLAAAIVSTVFVWFNIGAWIAYRDKTLSHSTVNGHHIGSVEFKQLDFQLRHSNALPSSLDFRYQNKRITVSLTSLGITPDTRRMEQYVRQHRSKLPVMYIFRRQTVPIYVSIDDARFKQGFASLSKAYAQDPVDAKITLENNMFSLTKEQSGESLQVAAVKSATLQALAASRSVVALPASVVVPKVTGKQLQTEFDALQKQVKSSVVIRYQSKNYSFKSQDIAALFVPSGSSYVLSDAALKAKITAIGSDFGIRVQNVNEAVTSTGDAIRHGVAQDFTLVAATITRNYNYCVQLKGVDASKQAEFEAKLRSVYADNRGWRLGGQVTFTQVSSGCTLRVWLAAAD